MALVVGACLAALGACDDRPLAGDGVERVSSAVTNISISGTVTGASGPIAGATISASGTTQASALSDAAGNYTLSVIPGSYQVTAGGLANCTFTPSSVNLNNLNANATQSFVGSGAGCAAGGGGSGFVSRAFFTQASNQSVLAMAFAPVLNLDVPAGSYAVTASTIANNLGTTRAPVLCALQSPSGSSVTVGAQLEPEVPQTEGRASAATIAVTFATTLTAPGRISLVCEQNSGVANPNATVGGRSMTAVSVGSVTVQ